MTNCVIEIYTEYKNRESTNENLSYYKMVKSFGLVLAFLLCKISYCYDVSLNIKSTEGCSVKDQLRGRDYRIPQDFTNNQPKVNEVFRLKSYYYGNSPMISFYAKGKISPRPTFTIFANYTTFALYNDVHDFITSRNPICTQSNVMAFSKDHFTEMDIFLMKGKLDYDGLERKICL